MGLWKKKRDSMVREIGAEKTDKILTEAQAEELDASLAESVEFDRKVSARYKKDIGLDKLQKLIGEPDKPTEWYGGH